MHFCIVRRKRSDHLIQFLERLRLQLAIVWLETVAIFVHTIIISEFRLVPMPHATFTNILEIGCNFVKEALYSSVFSAPVKPSNCLLWIIIFNHLMKPFTIITWSGNEPILLRYRDNNWINFFHTQLYRSSYSRFRSTKYATPAATIVTAATDKTALVNLSKLFISNASHQSKSKHYQSQKWLAQAKSTKRFLFQHQSSTLYLRSYFNYIRVPLHLPHPPSNPATPQNCFPP